MDWTYDRYSRIATNVREKVRLRYRVSEKSLNPESLKRGHVEIEAQTEEAQQYLRHEGESVRRNVCEAILEAERRHTIDKFVRTDCANSCAEAARIIGKIAHRRLTERTVQAWRIDPSKPSSRSCPEWAVKAAHDHRQAGQHARMGPSPIQDRDAPGWHALDVKENQVVQRATDQIERDQRTKDEWINAPMSELPKKIAALDIENQRWLNHHNSVLMMICNAIEESHDFNEFKDKVFEEYNAYKAITYDTTKAERDIVNGFREWASPDGALDYE